jgi:hypothetical protein
MENLEQRIRDFNIEDTRAIQKIIKERNRKYAKEV